MTLRDVLSRLTATTEAAIHDLWRKHQDGYLNEEMFTALAAAAIARANARAVTAGDVSVAIALTIQLGRAVAPVGLTPRDESERLGAAIGTVLAADVAYASTVDEQAESKALRLGRLATAEPVSAAQGAMTEAMQRQPVEGWTRGLSRGACPLCQSWADGEVRPAGVEMASHPGCSCVPQPVALT